MWKGSMVNMFGNVFSKIPMLGLLDPVINMAKNFAYKIWYTLTFAIIKAIAWILDMLTQLFFIFSGMTPISSTETDMDTGEAMEIDIVNFFLTQKSFQKAYLYLCLVALGLIVVFAIAKIIKQDYFDRNGPRSKGPIFRNIALSFIAFICIIPVFYFLIDVVAALAMLVMKAMGYKGGGIGTLIFNMSWDDGGESIRALAQSLGSGETEEVYITFEEWISNGWDDAKDGVVEFLVPGGLAPSKVYDADNFGWYSPDTFYAYFWDESNVAKRETVATFHWYIFIFTGLALIVNIGQMLLAMVTRLYNLIALFIVAPSPISQIVLDDGQKFKNWKDRVVQESLKVVGCVMSFMIFIMIVGVVSGIDLMRFAFEPESASSVSLLENNNLTAELSDKVDALYYYGDNISWVDSAINALGRCMIVIAGVGAIKDMDSIITPLISGGSSSMDMGKAGQAVLTAGGAAASGALELGRKGIGLAVKGATSIAKAGVGIGLGALNGLSTGKGAGEAIEGMTSALGKDGGGAFNPETAAAKLTADAADSLVEGELKDATSEKKGPATPTTEATDDSTTEETTPVVETPATKATDGPTTEATDDSTTEETTPVVETPATAATDGPTTEESATDGSTTEEAARTSTEGGASAARAQPKLPTVHNQGRLTSSCAKVKSRLGKWGGGAVAARNMALGAAAPVLKHGFKFAGTAAKTGLSMAGILAKTVLKMGGINGKAVDAAGNFISGVASDVGGAFKDLGADVKKQGGEFAKKHMVLKKDKNGNFVDKDGNSVNKDGFKVNEAGEVETDGDGNPVRGGKPVYADRIGAAMGTVSSAAGAVMDFMGDKGGIVGGTFRFASSRVDAYSRRRFTMDEQEEQALTDLSNAPTGQINSAMETLSSTTSADEVSSAADTIMAEADALKTNAGVQNGLTERIIGKKDHKLESTGVVARMDAAESAVKASAIRTRANASDARGTAFSGTRETADNVVSGISGRNPGVVNRIAQKRGIMELSEALKSDSKYESAIIAVERERRNPEARASSEDRSKYMEYMEKASQLDRAYRHVDGGSDASDTQGAAALAAVESQIRKTNAYKDSTGGFTSIPSTKKGKGRAKEIAKQLHSEETAFESAMQTRSQEINDGQYESLVEDAQFEARQDVFTADGVTAMDGLDVARSEFASAKRDFEAARKDHGNGSEQARDARQRLVLAGENLQNAASGVRGEMADNRTDIIRTSKHNAKINLGNQRYDTAREQLRVNIQRRKDAGASAESVAKDEMKLTRLDNLATSAGAKSARNDSSRSAGLNGHVTGTKRTVKAAVRVGKRATKDENKQKTRVVQPTAEQRVDMVNRMGTSGSYGTTETVVDLTVLEREISVNSMTGTPSLTSMVAAYGKYKDSGFEEAGAREFISSVSGVTTERLEYSDELRKAIANIKRADIPTEKKGMGVAMYQREATARYESAVKSYNENIQRAVNLSKEYSTSSDPQTLKGVTEAIAKAANSSEEIRILKVELGMEKGKK